MPLCTARCASALEPDGRHRATALDEEIAETDETPPNLVKSYKIDTGAEHAPRRATVDRLEHFKGGNFFGYKAFLRRG